MKKIKWQWILGSILLVLILAVVLDKKTAIQTVSEQNLRETLVIDAGHGGFDGGAVGASGVIEKDINLSIAQRVSDLAAFFGYQTKMTRTTDTALDYNGTKTIRQNKVADIKARESIVNSIQSPVFISIHLNKFSDAQYHGAQVFYSGGNEKGKPLAESVQEKLISGVDTENHRQAKKAENSIYLMKRLTCPAIIVECGFLSNPTEEIKLTNEEYHKKLAMCILSGYMAYNTSQ